MALPVEINPLQFKTSGGYTVSNSLRFRSFASAYLNRTPPTAGNQQKFTWSGWVKRGALASEQCLISTRVDDNNKGFFSFTSGDALYFLTNSGGTIVCQVTTSALFRDPSAWYHIVLAVDTTQATATSRVLMYVNGVLQNITINTQVSQNTNLNFNIAQATAIGRQQQSTPTNYFDGYLTEINFIDGQQLTPSSFGTYDANGVWQPIKYSGTYGTNGFYLTFGNTTSTTTLGYDTSGNSNNWTTNNISLTAGKTYDSMTDSPTVTSATVANYAVFNPLSQLNSASTYLTNGNLQFTDASNGSVWRRLSASIATNSGSGKFYWEAQITSLSNAIGNQLGIVTATDITSGAPTTTGWQLYWNIVNYQKIGPSGTTTLTGTPSVSDLVTIAYDAVNGQIWFGRNGTWFEGNPSAGTGASFTGISVNTIPYAAVFTVSGSSTGFAINFGQQPFIYTPPTGFKALNTYNLPTPTIANGAQYMAATTYTGNGSTQSINNGNNTTIATTFQPNLVWFKGRSVATNHLLEDSVRGAGYGLNSNLTNAESSGVGTGLTSFASTGFALSGDFSGAGSCNVNGTTYVAWQWQAGTAAGSSNTNGSITSTVSANTTAGFSIVAYTGTGANATVGHGLGVAPSMIITKVRSTSGADWSVYHSALGATQYLLLDTTAAAASSVNFWNNTAPTSSVFSVGISGGTNNSGNTMIAYCWAAVPGYSAFGSYTGNGSTDGPFVYTGFRPRWMMMKRSDAIGSWYMFDTSRDTYDVMSAVLLASASDAETSVVSVDALSNGFKLRLAGAPNVSSGTYIYAAFAENPFNSSRAR